LFLFLLLQQIICSCCGIINTGADPDGFQFGHGPSPPFILAMDFGLPPTKKNNYTYMI